MQLNASKVDAGVEKPIDVGVRTHRTNGAPAAASTQPNVANVPGVAGGVGARGAGVRALLLAHEELASALKGNSALLSKLNNLTHSLTP